MIGQISDAEMKRQIMHGSQNSTKGYIQGRICLKRGYTYNYYRRESDNSWTNYDCKTKSRPDLSYGIT